jgi:hypothetical protein
MTFSFSICALAFWAQGIDGEAWPRHEVNSATFFLAIAEPSLRYSKSECGQDNVARSTPSDDHTSRKPLPTSSAAQQS